MSAWGNKDDIASPGTVSLSGSTVTGTGTFFANNYVSGDVIKFNTHGSAVINAISNSSVMTVVSVAEISLASLTANTYSVSEKPVYLVDTDTNTQASDVYGVSVAEKAWANTTSDVYRAAHAGWVKIGDQYTDANGNTRQKSEVLVAMSSISGDADDDTGNVALPEG
jgi:hypothetical protein|tara:strand:- start:629 stop:1129 length:501 start_codon:yes stop_codon:yes gene_type:complete